MHGKSPARHGLAADGATALMVAASAGHHGMAKLLLEGGASTSALDSEGSTALGRAKAKRDFDMIQLISRASGEDAGERPQPEVSESCGEPSWPSRSHADASGGDSAPSDSETCCRCEKRDLSADSRSTSVCGDGSGSGSGWGCIPYGHADADSSSNA